MLWLGVIDVGGFAQALQNEFAGPEGSGAAEGEAKDEGKDKSKEDKDKKSDEDQKN